MIKRIQIRNYKSLRNLDFELTERNLLVGPNMSGKTNFIDSLKFLSQMCIGGVNQAFLNRGGYAEVAWKGENGGPIFFRLSVEEDSEDGKIPQSFEYEISIIGTAKGLISIDRERLTARRGDSESTLIDLRNGQGEIRHMDGNIAFTTSDPTKSALEYAVPGWEGMQVKYHISAWRYYHLSPEIMKQANAAVSQQYLVENGQNFSSWLMTLQTSYPKEFGLIKQVATDSLPGLEEVLAPPTQFATTYVTTREKYLKYPINVWHMSEGEIMFLAWLSLIFAPPAFGAPLFCAEEIENHLHPRLMEILFEVLSQRRKELQPDVAQIIVTTHSPLVVDKVDLGDLIISEKKDGGTILTRPETKTHLRKLLQRKELGLGELWYSGALGD